MDHAVEAPMKSLDKLHPGESAVICKINGNTFEETYLMEMGLLEGTPIRLVKFAPLGDPLELAVRGYHLSIRRSEASAIYVDGETR